MHLPFPLRKENWGRVHIYSVRNNPLRQRLPAATARECPAGISNMEVIEKMCLTGSKFQI